jgi:hypothetical protein
MRLVRRRTRAAVVAAALIAAGCGSSGEGASGDAGPLGWKGEPVLTVADNLPDDRILVGTVRNVSIREELKLDATTVVVRDAAGKRLEAFALFSHTYAHGLYGQAEAPDGPLGEDRERLGYVRTVKPGEEAPVTVAYRLTKATRPPLRIDYGPGELSVPTTLSQDRE